MSNPNKEELGTLCRFLNLLEMRLGTIRRTESFQGTYNWQWGTMKSWASFWGLLRLLMEVYYPTFIRICCRRRLVKGRVILDRLHKNFRVTFGMWEDVPVMELLLYYLLLLGNDKGSDCFRCVVFMNIQFVSVNPKFGVVLIDKWNAILSFLESGEYKNERFL